MMETTGLDSVERTGWFCLLLLFCFRVVLFQLLGGKRLDFPHRINKIRPNRLLSGQSPFDRRVSPDRPKSFRSLRSRDELSGILRCISSKLIILSPTLAHKTVSNKNTLCMNNKSWLSNPPRFKYRGFGRSRIDQWTRNWDLSSQGFWESKLRL